MPSGPVHDFRVFTPPSFTRWRYNSDRYESVRLPRYGNLASCTSSEQSAQAMELFVVPKSMPRAPLLVLGAREDIRDLPKLEVQDCMCIWREAILSLAISREGDSRPLQSEERRVGKECRSRWS